MKVQWTSIIKNLNENLSAQSPVKHKICFQDLEEKKSVIISNWLLGKPLTPLHT